MSDLRCDSGVYVLLVELDAPAEVRVGALGPARFAPGAWLYVGRARRGLVARARRHLRRDKPRRWHVDHLVAARAARPRWVLLLDGADECALNRAVAALPSAGAPVRGFGASDCAEGCPAHLWRLDRAPEPRALARRLGLPVLGVLRAEPAAAGGPGAGPPLRERGRRV